MNPYAMLVQIEKDIARLTGSDQFNLTAFQLLYTGYDQIRNGDRVKFFPLWSLMETHIFVPVEEAVRNQTDYWPVWDRIRIALIPVEQVTFQVPNAIREHIRQPRESL